MCISKGKTVRLCIWLNIEVESEVHWTEMCLAQEYLTTSPWTEYVWVCVFLWWTGHPSWVFPCLRPEMLGMAPASPWQYWTSGLENGWSPWTPLHIVLYLRSLLFCLLIANSILLFTVQYSPVRVQLDSKSLKSYAI